MIFSIELVLSVIFISLLVLLCMVFVDNALQYKIIKTATCKLQKSFDNYGILEYINRISRIKRISNMLGQWDILMKDYEMIMEEKSIDLALKVQLRTVMRSISNNFSIYLIPAMKINR